MKTVLIPDHVSSEFKVEKKILGDDYQIICYHNEDEHISESDWKKADGIILWHHINLNKDLINKINNCKVIVRAGVGFDNVDIELAKKRKIIVCNVPDYGTNDVADHSMALLLSLVRGIEKYNNDVKNNKKWDWYSAGELNRISNSTLGIVGLGRIGTSMALRAKAFGMKVIFFDPFVPNGQDKALNITRCNSLATLLKESDVVSIHTPLTKETKRLANKTFFKHMKDSAIIINTARGQIFDLDDLYNALLNNEIRAVGTDVLPDEPPNENHKLIKDWKNNESWISGRLLITPHSAFYNRESLIELREKAANELKGVLENKHPLNRVNY